MIQRQAVRPAWLTARQSRDPLWLPPHGVGAAWAVDTVRALLAEERITAWKDFCAIVETARPSVEAVYRRAVADNKWARGWMAGRRRIMKRMFTKGEMPPSYHTFDKTAVELAEAFSVGWLRGSSVGAWIVMELATIAIVRVDPAELDKQRFADSEVFAGVYGWPTTRPGRKAQRDTRRELKVKGWKPRRGQEREEACFDWVEYEHLYGGNMKAWLHSRITGAIPYKEGGNASERFKPLEVAFSIRRRRGPHPKVRAPVQKQS